MHYVRKIEQGTNDPRLHTYFVYECALCNHEHYFDWQRNFDTTRLRKCNNCGVTNDTSNEEALIKRKHELEQLIKQASEELSKVSSELNTLQKMLANQTT